jgi:glycopeptide antibiotics resistance protein
MYAEYIRWILAVLAIIVATLSVKSLLSKSDTAKWAKKGLFCLYLCGIVWGLLLMLELSHFAMMTIKAYHLIDLFKNIIAGMIIGMFCILFLSGELNLNKWKKNN